MAADVRMAQRDASWYRFPNTRSLKVYHVVVSPPYVAACNSNTLLVEESESPLASVAPAWRCQRKACRNAWEGGDDG